MKNKNNKRLIQVEAVPKAPKIEMENKRYISVNASAKAVTDEELKIIIKTLEGENLEIRTKCYKQNTPILTVKKRKFTDLVKKFWDEYLMKSQKAEHNLRKFNI